MRRRLRARIAAEELGGERGNASVEFLGLAMVLIVPLVYLVLVLAELQGAVFAAEGAARDAGRVVATADSRSEALADAKRVVELAFADQGLSVDGSAALVVTCEAADCSAPGGSVHVVVRAAVPMPLVPQWLGAVMPLEIPVQAQAWTAIDQFRER